MNLSIGSFFKIIVLVCSIVLMVLLYVVRDINTKSQELVSLQESRYNTRLVADVLRQSSDDLSKFARLYVSTSDVMYKENYNKVLYIRNGELPLPENYQNIYWDLLEPVRSKRHPDTKKIAFESMIKSLPYDQYELKKLKEAKDNSDDLVNLEIEAFNAMIGLYKDSNGNYTKYDKPNQKKAIDLLSSKEYLKAKEKIMLPIDQFLEHLDKRTNNEIEYYKEIIERDNSLLLVVSLSLLFIFFVSLVLIRKKVIVPIKYLTETISKFRLKQNISKKIFFDDEMGYMTEEFFTMKNEIEEDMKLIGKNKREMEEYLKLVDQNVITSSTDLDGTILSVSEAFCNISGYTKDELIGKNHRIVKHNDMPKEVYDELWSAISNDEKWHGELKNKDKNGSEYWVEATIYPNYDDNGVKVGYTAIRINITSKKLVESLLEESKLKENKIQQYIELVDKNIITSSTDISGKITYVSEAFAEISGYTKSELIGQNHRILKHEDNNPAIYENMWETISNNRVWNGIIKNKKKDGGFYWVDATIYPVFNDYGEKTGYTAIRIDITDRKKVEKLLITDALTGIYNRRFFNEMLPKAINIAKRDKKYISFIIMDIDHFKQYNDTYGHQEGDEVLVKVATCINNTLNRASDMCFRLGGEEFGVIFESLDPKSALDFANNIKESIENLKIEHSKNNVSPYVTASIGLVTKKTDKGCNPDTLYKEADDLLYKAKELGRNRVEAN